MKGQYDVPYCQYHTKAAQYPEIHAECLSIAEGWRECVGIAELEPSEYVMKCLFDHLWVDYFSSLTISIVTLLNFISGNKSVL